MSNFPSTEFTFFPTRDNPVLLLETSRLAGPLLLVASLVLLCASVGRGLLKRIRRRRGGLGGLAREEEDSTEGRELELDMEQQHLDIKQLLHHNHDIACFPDGSLRFVICLTL